jgi:8-amino-7-oxononanoate synthase
MSWRVWAQRYCQDIEKDGQWRSPLVFDAKGHAGSLVSYDDNIVKYKKVVAFASNDYLGLTCHPTVVQAAHTALDSWGTGSGASRLVTGTRPLHRQLEVELAAWKGADCAVVFPTGFAANLGVLTTFGTSDVLICSDELNHASIVDGCRLARSRVSVYKHKDLDHLESLLSAALSDQQVNRFLIVTDAVFSMDGDMIDLTGLAQLAAKHKALLVLDEAHSVLGPDVDVSSLNELGVDILRVGTLSKTFGALGGFVAGSREMVDLLVNKARSYIFTTALSPSDAGAALASLSILRSFEGERLKTTLKNHVMKVVGHLENRSKVLPSANLDMSAISPIIPVIVGSEEAALRASKSLLESGVWVPAIRPPTVPEGTSRLRISLSAAHTDSQIDLLIDALAGLDNLETGEPLN